MTNEREEIILTGYAENDSEQGRPERSIYGHLPDGREVLKASVVFSNERFDWYSYTEGVRRVFVSQQEADTLISHGEQ